MAEEVGLPRIFFPEQMRRHVKGTASIDLQVQDYRELMQALTERFPGIDGQIENQMIVAIDGEIIHNPFLEKIAENAEVYFLPKINAG